MIIRPETIENITKQKPNVFFCLPLLAVCAPSSAPRPGVRTTSCLAEARTSPPTGTTPTSCRRTPRRGGRTTWATTTPRPSTLRAVSRLSRFFSTPLHSDRRGTGGGQPSRETQGDTPVPVPCPPCPRPSPPRDPPCFLQNKKSTRQRFVIACVVCHCE